MDERRQQFAVGVLVFGMMLISGLLILMNSDFSWSPWQEQYQLQVLVDQAPGVSPDTPVRRRGILIGRVAEVEDIDDGALITINVNEGKNVKTNEVARVQTSLIGDAVIEFTPTAAPPEGAQVVQPGGPPLPGMYNPSPTDLIANLQGDLKQTILSLGNAGNEVSKLASQLNKVMSEQDIERINRLIVSLEEASTNFASVMANADEVLGDEAFKTQLKEGLTELPSVISDAKEILGVLELAVESADENLQNLQGLTGPLGERGPEIVDAIESSADNLSELLGEIALLSKNLNRKEGTIGRLIHDDELYRKIAGAVGQASGAITDVRMLINDPELERRIRMILYNVWVATDKLARDPARVARGIFPKNRETPIK